MSQQHNNRREQQHVRSAGQASLFKFRLAIMTDEDSDKSKTTRVSRPLSADVLDLGNLLLVESNDLELGADDQREIREEKLKSCARDNAQELLNSLFALTPKRVDDVLVVPLPPPEQKLPRAKPLPKPRPPTRWEQYAKEKGIQKKTKGKAKLVWDDVVKEWVPRYGYKKAKAEERKNWMMEYKGNADPTEDPFEKAREDKRERVAKNELQRLRNIARTRKVKVPGVGLTPVVASEKSSSSSSRQGSTELGRAAALAKGSTASLGKFQPGLTSALEKQAKKGDTSTGGRKRKFDPLVSAGEKEKNLKILEQVRSKRPKLDVGKAVGVAMHTEEVERAEQKKTTAKKKSGKATGGGKGKRKGGGGGGRGGKNRGAKKAAGGHGAGGGTKRRGGAGKKPKKGGGGKRR